MLSLSCSFLGPLSLLTTKRTPASTIILKEEPLVVFIVLTAHCHEYAGEQRLVILSGAVLGLVSHTLGYADSRVVVVEALKND